MSKANFILCDDGSFLHIRNITRLFLAEDTITKGCSIKAGMIGAAMPFMVADFANRAIATVALQELIYAIEGKACETTPSKHSPDERRHQDRS